MSLGLERLTSLESTPYPDGGRTMEYIVLPSNDAASGNQSPAPAPPATLPSTLAVASEARPPQRERSATQLQTTVTSSKVWPFLGRRGGATAYQRYSFSLFCHPPPTSQRRRPTLNISTERRSTSSSTLRALMRALKVAQDDDDFSQGVASSSAKGDVGFKLRARLRVDNEHDTDQSLSPRSKLRKAACTFAAKPAIYCRPKVRARRIRTTTSTPYMLPFHAHDAVHHLACF